MVWKLGGVAWLRVSRLEDKYKIILRFSRNLVIIKLCMLFVRMLKRLRQNLMTQQCTQWCPQTSDGHNLNLPQKLYQCYNQILIAFLHKIDLFKTILPPCDHLSVFTYIRTSTFNPLSVTLSHFCIIISLSSPPLIPFLIPVSYLPPLPPNQRHCSIVKVYSNATRRGRRSNFRRL